MEAIIVWFLIASDYSVSRYAVLQIAGPLADLESCRKVQQAAPLRRFDTECVQVKIPKGAKP